MSACHKEVQAALRCTLTWPHGGPCVHIPDPVATERARIVALLRRRATGQRGYPAIEDALLHAASMIERGER